MIAKLTLGLLAALTVAWTASAQTVPLITEEMMVKAADPVELAALAGLCNAVEFDVTTIHLPLADRKIIGDATDQAVLRFSESLTDVATLRNAWKKVFELAFNSKNKFMVRVLRPVAEGSRANVLSREECEAFGEGDL